MKFILKCCQIKKENQGFSLIEVLTVFVIIGLLIVVGVDKYKDHEIKTTSNWAKSELIEISKMLHAMRVLDGSYHQFIYQMGYLPKGKILASVGTSASRTAICCSEYPEVGTNPCRKDLGTGSDSRQVYKSGWTHYNCKSGNRFSAVQNIQICDDSNYSLSCQKEEGVEVFSATDFSSCSITPSTWCDCDSFTLGAKTYRGKKFSFNEKGALCKE